MAKFQTPPAETINLGFHALADATRRAVIQRLHHGDASATVLADPFDMALPTFMKHLKVLEAGGLITTEKVGRKRMCRLERDQLARLSSWINEYEAGWQNKLDRLGTMLTKGENS